MKRIITSLALIATLATSAYAETLLDGNKATDNWSIGIAGGVNEPLNFKKDKPNAIVGVDVRKGLTPVIGVGIEGRWTIGTPQYMVEHVGESTNAFDSQYVGAFGTLNFMNWFGGYKGEPRAFEIEAQAGLGWLHYYYPTANTGIPDHNSFGVKAGINFCWSAGEKKAWTFRLSPYVLYDLGKDARTQVAAEHNLAGFNVNRATFNLEISAAYNFKCSNGKHHFGLTKAFDQAELDELNGKINALRGEINSVDGQIAGANDEIARLKAALAACVATPKVVETETVTKTSNLESVVTFAKAASTVAPAQLPNVERVATYLKNHSNAKVVIRGFASPEGNPEVNARLATARAEAVKNLLVNKYKIAASRIDAEGNGVGDMFSEPDWNRVSICTINE